MSYVYLHPLSKLLNLSCEDSKYFSSVAVIFRYLPRSCVQFACNRFFMLVNMRKIEEEPSGNPLLIAEGFCNA